MTALRFTIKSIVVTALAFVAHACWAQNDPLYQSSGSWGQDQEDQWALKRVNMPEISSGETVVVAVIDPGIDYYHPDLDAESIWRNSEEEANGIDDDGNGYIDDLIGWNFLDNDNTPWDHSGHGTHTAGIIAAATNNGIGIAGMNPDVKIMPLKTMNFYGRGESLQIAAAIYYAVENGAQVINMSIGSEGPSKVEEMAIEYAHQQGVVVVVAAGNLSIDAADFAPAGIAGAITVSALDADNERPPYANFGHSVDIAAPGDDVLSLRARQTDFTWIDGPPDYEVLDNVVGEDLAYYRATGTSFSAPFVAGAASLLLSQRPELTAEQIERMLLQSAVDVVDPGWDVMSGYGLLDVTAALAADPEYFVESRIFSAGLAQTSDGYVIQVAGTTDANEFEEAWIEVGAGDDPTEWHRVVDNIESPARETVVGEFGIDILRSSPRWIVRLITTHKDGSQRETRYVLNLG